jgi:hypothetical protein
MLVITLYLTKPRRIWRVRNDKILDMSKRLDDFVIEMITRHYLMAEGKLGRVTA